MMKIFSFYLLILSFSSFASQRTLKAIHENVSVDLEQVKGSPDKYYARVSHLEFPLNKQVVLVKRGLSREFGFEDFFDKDVGFRIKLGGTFSSIYSRPTKAGVLFFQGREIPLTVENRTIQLENLYLKEECWDISDRAEADKELQKQLESLNQSCNSSITLDVNWKGFKPSGRACNGREFLKSIETLCGDKDYKAALRKFKIVKLIQGNEKASFSKLDKTLIYKIGKSAQNTKVISRKWLEDNL